MNIFKSTPGKQGSTQIESLIAKQNTSDFIVIKKNYAKKETRDITQYLDIL